MNEPTANASGLTVTVVKRHDGSLCLVRIEHDGVCMTLDRDEALELREQLCAKTIEQAKGMV